jgi:hypothetical protein
MGHRERLKRLEASGLLGDTLVLDDGREIRCRKGEIFDALLASISGEEHRLIPDIYRAQGELGELHRALQGTEKETK